MFNEILIKLRSSKSQELSQSIVRLVLVIVVSTYLFGYYLIYPEKEVITLFIWAVIIYFTYCLFLTTHILIYIDFKPARQYFTIVFDMSLVCIGMYSGDIASAFFYGGYYWIILGNGCRFGQRSLIISSVLAVVSFSVVIITTKFWQDNIELGLGLMIWLILLPTYIGKLIKAKETALEYAQLADNAKSRFITNMSHELRTPLNGIIGYSQMIHEDDINHNESKLAAKKIDKSSQHLLSLINELLDMASIESGKTKILFEEIEISPLLDEVTTLVESTASKRNVKLRIEPFESQKVIADRLRLKQVLINLISNAVKYNYENGVVAVSYTIDKKIITINVCDNGPGLSKNEQEQLFKPFERLDTKSSEVEGAGIGLVITKNLVNMMRGEIGINS